MKKRNKIILLAICCLGILALLYLPLSSPSKMAEEAQKNLNLGTDNPLPEENNETAKENTAENKAIPGEKETPGKILSEESVTLKINDVAFAQEIPGPMSVYDLMDRMRKEGKIIFTERTYSGMGKLITGINGIESNGRQTWIYHVNGVEAKIGISNYIIKPGDVVSWEYDEVHY